ncbi:dTDP-glucose 4,6-dehydratase [Clostridium formicaceticum]|uniref:dTDP-glucose 4,6-dehydratase n=1 Tax=Clostridium formicaceticum TaxID=1497 RepID=A0AAC9RI39_9CLOT|nr:dTDP-glucose 4,6-dehydratase [Clostridium formicaceticum]AOY76985.1 dTDP-glucose 4,6-dehydratase [Clostridium formicaceticum]ARE87471.1 dTDP-glucose 4,6-dehydratase [Clostridium formicaceticum]
MKTYLVTGGAGFIGSNFIIYILKTYGDIQIINADMLTYAGNLENLKEVENNPKHIFAKVDICDKEAIGKIFEKYAIDCVVNFAAESHVDRSIYDPEVFVRTNVLGTQNLLNVAKKAWEKKNGFDREKKFIQISTDEVYGSLGDVGYFTENTALDPHSPYAASKAAADLIVKAYYDTYKMPVNITRCSNNYGSYQFPEKLIPLIINNCLNKKALPVYGDGLNVRDWLYVEDHCRAIDRVIRKGSIGEVYNIGGHNERTNIYIVKTVIKYISENLDNTINEDLIKYVEDRKGHDRRYGIDPSKIKEELGWKPTTSFEEGIKKTIHWYIKNKAWLDGIASGEYTNYFEKMYGNL